MNQNVGNFLTTVAIVSSNFDDLMKKKTLVV